MHFKFRNLAVHVANGQAPMYWCWTEGGGRDRILRVATLEIIISRINVVEEKEIQSEQVSQSISNPGE